MATKRIPVSLTPRESRQIYGQAKQFGLSFSNYVRRLLGLPLLKHGGSRKKAVKPPTEEEK